MNSHLLQAALPEGDDPISLETTLADITARLQGRFGTHLIAEEIGANAALETDDLDHGTLKSRGGLPRALALFGKDRLPTLLEELNTALAA